MDADKVGDGEETVLFVIIELLLLLVFVLLLDSILSKSVQLVVVAVVELVFLPLILPSLLLYFADALILFMLLLLLLLLNDGDDVSVFVSCFIDNNAATAVVLDTVAVAEAAVLSATVTVVVMDIGTLVMISINVVQPILSK